MPRSILVALLLAAACSAGDTDGPACAECSVTLEPGVRLLPGESVSFVISTKVVQAASGNLFAAPIANRSAVAIFSPTGEPLGVVGRKGPGPGELGVVERIYAVGDSIFVVEEGGQVEVFSSAGEWRGSLRDGEWGAAFWPLPDGKMVTRSRGESGPLFVATRENTSRIQLAAPVPRGDERAPRWRHVSTDATGRVWTTVSSPGDDLYRVAVLDPAGGDPAEWEHRLHRLIEPGWFRDPTYFARVSDLALTAPDTLMVLLHRALMNPPPPPKAKQPRGEQVARMLTIDEATEKYEYFLDVISPEARRLIARVPLPKGWIGGFVRPGELFTIEEREDLELVVQLWKARISTE